MYKIPDGVHTWWGVAMPLSPELSPITKSIVGAIPGRCFTTSSESESEESVVVAGGCRVTLRGMVHRQNIPITQSTPDPTMFSWGGWPCEKKNYLPPLAMLRSPVLSRLSGHSDPIVLEPFDVTLWYSGVPRTLNFLKISSDIECDFRHGFFSTLHTDFRVESNFYDHY